MPVHTLQVTSVPQTQYSAPPPAPPQQPQQYQPPPVPHVQQVRLAGVHKTIEWDR